MEPVSLSIGAVGLISLLTTCVECFEYIDAAKACGRDLELLTTKFSIEKARLLIWGESVGISSTNATGSNKVESPHFRPIVEKILNCIRMLFEDTNALTVRYGLKPMSNDASSPSLALARPSASGETLGLPLRLKASYIRFKSRIEQNHKQTTTSKKTKWAIRDRQKFMSLVEDIHQFINGLEAITDSVEMATKRAALVREELSTVEDPEDLRLIAEASAGGNQQWSDAASIALRASVSGASHDVRIMEWMNAVSDSHFRSSTAVDFGGADKAPDFTETGSGNHDPSTALEKIGPRLLDLVLNWVPAGSVITTHSLKYQYRPVSTTTLSLKCQYRPVSMCDSEVLKLPRHEYLGYSHSLAKLRRLDIEFWYWKSEVDGTMLVGVILDCLDESDDWLERERKMDLLMSSPKIWPSANGK